MYQIPAGVGEHGMQALGSFRNLGGHTVSSPQGQVFNLAEIKKQDMILSSEAEAARGRHRGSGYFQEHFLLPPA